MHHFFEAITNTAGDSLIGYFARVINRTTQNTVTLSSDENGTPIVVVSGVENMAKTDDYGNLSLYVEPGTYHLDIYAPNTTTFLFRVSDVAMNSTKGDPGPQGEQGETGADGEGLADVMAPNGAGLVGFTQAGTGAVTRTALAKAREKVTPADFGAVGNGGTNDTAAISSAVTASGGTAFLIGGDLELPKGQYRTSGGTLSGSQFWRMHGGGQLSSFFVNGGLTSESFLTVPGSYGFVGYDDFGARNYKSFLKCGGNVEQVTSRNLHVFNGSGYAFDITGFLITGQFDNLHLDGQNQAGSGGFKVGGSFNNLLFTTPQFNNLAESAFDLQFSEGVATINLRAEGGNAPAKSFMKLANGTHQHITHINAYIEGEYEFIISADGAGAVPYNGSGVVSFIGSHFTYWQAGVPFKWAITSPFNMLANDFNLASRVPPTAQVLGYNHNLIRAEYVSSTPFVSKKRRPATLAGTGPFVQDVIVLSRNFLDNSPNNRTTWVGTMRYAAGWSNVDGGAAGDVAAEYRVVVQAIAGGNMTITVSEVFRQNNGNAATVLAIAPSGAASATALSVIATWTGINPTTIAYFDQQFSVDWNQSAGVAIGTLAISEAT